MILISRSSYSLGNQDHFNDILDSEEDEFTYLVPSNGAWEEVQHMFASAHKQLFLGTFGYQVRQFKRTPGIQVTSFNEMASVTTNCSTFYISLLMLRERLSTANHCGGLCNNINFS